MACLDRNVSRSRITTHDTVYMFVNYSYVESRWQ